MTEYLTKKLTEILKTDLMDEYEVEILEYGITTTFLNLPKTILLIFIAKKLNLLKPVLLLLFFYGIIRKYSRGIHAKTPLGCLLVGTANYLSMAYLSKIITVPQCIYNAVFVYCLCIFSKYSPSGTEVNPVYKDQIMPMKVRSILTAIIYYIIGLKDGIIRNILMLSLVSQSISILPLTYKLANQKGGMVHDEE